MSSLEELLDRGGAQDPVAPSRPTIQWLVKAVLGAAVLAAAAMLVAYSVGYVVWYPLMFTGMFALLVLHRAVTGLAAVPLVDRRADQPDATPQVTDGLELAARRWRTRLGGGRTGRSGRGLPPGLAELVDERLWQRRGITRTGDPERARAVLGGRLWRYLSDPPARIPPPRELAVLLDDVESI